DREPTGEDGRRRGTEVRAAVRRRRRRLRRRAGWPRRHVIRAHDLGEAARHRRHRREHERRHAVPRQRLTAMTLLPPHLDQHAVAAAALEGLRDGVLVVSGGEVLVANRAAHSLMGRSPSELAGGPAPVWVAAAEARGGATEVALPGAGGRRRRATVTVVP